MDISGLDGISEYEMHNQIRQGARFVVFQYTLSIVVLTFKRNSKIYFIRPGESTFSKSWPYTLLSMLFGWWGFPWGFIYTPQTLYRNLQGGLDVTQLVLQETIPLSAIPH